MALILPPPTKKNPIVNFCGRVSLEYIPRNGIVSCKVYATSTLPSNFKLFYKVLISIYIPTREVDVETEISCRKFIREYS